MHYVASGALACRLPNRREPTVHRSTLQEALELSLLLADHDIDPLTSYCRDCGQAMGHILAHSLRCFRAPNIVAFSHRRAAQRLEQSIEAHRSQRRSIAERLDAAHKLMMLDEAPDSLIDFSVLQDPDSWAPPDQPA